MCIFGNVNLDYIIVGLGLAGLSFAEQLTENNNSFIVFEDNSQTSSLVAGGVYNPVILKRFTPVWNGHSQIQKALPFYQMLEEKFNQKFDYKFTTRKVFNSIEDENNWFVASDKPMLNLYMKPQIVRENSNGVVAEYGFGELNGTGRIDTKKLIDTYREFLQKEEKIRNQKFEYSQIEFQENTVSYQDITAKRIVFCEGFGIKENPFFKEYPLKEAKINGFIRGIVSSKLIEGYDKDGDGYINWNEFKTAVDEINKAN